MAQSLHDRIKGYEKSSEAYMAEVPAACAKGDREAVYHLLREYIRCRFVLVDDDFWSDDFDELSEYSIRKLLRLQKDEPLHDISMTCTGSSSVTTRKVLLPESSPYSGVLSCQLPQHKIMLAASYGLATSYISFWPISQFMFQLPAMSVFSW